MTDFFAVQFAIVTTSTVLTVMFTSMWVLLVERKESALQVK